MSADRPSPRRQGGFALLLVLWALVLITLLATQVGAAGCSEATLALNLRRAAAVQAATDGAIEATAFHLLDAPAARWAADGTPHELRLPGAAVTLRVTDEAGKVDPNTASPALMAALLRGVGASPAQAAALAGRIGQWIFPTGDTGPDAPQNAPYRAAGLAYGPPGAPFESVDELGEVLGMTPALLAALRPHVTVYAQGNLDPAFADPVVQRAARAAGMGEGAGPAAPGQQQGLRTVTVTALGVGAGGARSARQAVLRIGAHRGAFLRILAWETLAS